MSPVMAVKTYLEKDSVHGKISATEYMAFWKSCSDAERADFAQSAASALDIELKTS